MMNIDVDGMRFMCASIKIPIGGSEIFEVPCRGGKTEPMREVYGTIIAHHSSRMLFNKETNKKECYSPYGHHGSTGEICGTCTCSQKRDFEPPECKLRQVLYVLMEGMTLPVTLTVPPGSIFRAYDYFRDLEMFGDDFRFSITKFTAKRAVSKGGSPYSQIFLSHERDMTEQEIEKALAVSNRVLIPNDAARQPVAINGGVEVQQLQLQ
jgi:hypothetical protein